MSFTKGRTACRAAKQSWWNTLRAAAGIRMSSCEFER